MEGPYKDSVYSPPIAGFEWQNPQNDKDVSSFQDLIDPGCTILVVTPDEDQPNLNDTLYYSVGFYLNLRHPEILVVGMSNDYVVDLINSLFRDVESGKTIEDGQTIKFDLGEGERELIAKRVPQERYTDYLGWACWFYRSLQEKAQPLPEHQFPVLQLFWPDNIGYYPWDPECDPIAIQAQTLVAKGQR